MRRPRDCRKYGERAGHHREHDVVDGGAERVLDELELVEARAHDPDPAVRARRHVERGVGRVVERGPRDLADAGGDLARPLERLARARDGAERARGHLRHRAHRARQPARGQLGARRLGLRHPRLAAVAPCAGPRARGRTAPSRGRRPRRRRRPRDGSSRRARSHQPSSPSTSHSSHSGFERSSRWEKTRPHILSSASSSPGARQRRVAHVVGEVEARVVDPQRPAGLERRRRELLPVARDEVQARLDVREERVERRRLALEQREAADVHVRVRLLLRQEAGIDRREPIEMLLLGHGFQ